VALAQTIPLIEAADVSRHFTQGGQTIDALLPASFRVWPGDRIALIGPSGCGKSTLLQLMADLDQPSGGILSWPGLGTSGTLRPSRIGMVFQVPSLLPMLSVIENIELPMRLAGDGQNSRVRAAAALGAVGLAGLDDKLPDELSGGQAQRVGIARALAPRPPLLLADEPTGQLDRATAKTVLDVMLETLRGTQTALVVATHDPTVAARLDVVWTMSYGQLAIPVSVGPRELVSL
jgi:ABC-type lipoprotein export system ATPase subunit